MAVFLGLDCGGSSCRAVAMDEAGAVLFQGQSGPANILSTPRGRLRANLRHAVDGCPEPAVVCGCFAGLLTATDRSLARTLLLELFPNAEIRCEPDYVAALLASPPGTDVCVVSGTGSVICSRSGEALAKSGGRGYLLGNPGSAFAFGRDAIRCYLEQGEGAVGHHLLKEIDRRFDSRLENDVVAAVHRSGTPAAVLARFATPWGRDAAEGNPLAMASVRKGTGRLARQTADHIGRFVSGSGVVQVCLAGGLWSGPSIYRECYEEAVAEAIAPRKVRIARIEQPPVRGAVRLAMETNR